MKKLLQIFGFKKPEPKLEAKASPFDGLIEPPQVNMVPRVSFWLNLAFYVCLLGTFILLFAR